MTNIRTTRLPSSGFVYFFGGTVASTGINILTSVISSPSRDLMALLLALAGVGPLFIGYYLSRIAAIYGHYEVQASLGGVGALSEEEILAVERELENDRNAELERYKLLLVLSGITTGILLIGHELILHYHA